MFFTTRMRVMTSVYTETWSAGMSHAIRDKQKLLARVRRIKGQLEAVERALECDAGCDRVMHLIAGARGAMNGLTTEVVEDHVRSNLVGRDDAVGGDAVEQLIETIRTYMK